MLLLLTVIGLSGVYREVKADNLGFDQSISGKWILRLQVDQETEKNYQLTKTENDYCRGKMAQLIEIFKNNPALKSPQGFNVYAATRYTPPDDWYGQHKVPYKNWRVRMEFEAILPGLFRDQGKAQQTEGGPGFQVTFNEPGTLITNWELQYQGLWDEQDREIFLEPSSEHQVGGVTVYERGNTVIIAKSGRPLWVPVTQEQYLKAQYKHYQRIKNEGKDDPSMVLDFINERLNAMSPAERRQTAYYSSGAEDPSGLVSPDYEGAFKLVTFNPEYYDRSLPRTAVQLIVIGYGGDFTNYEETHVKGFEEAGTIKTLYDLEQSLDYQAVKKLLD
ncbi:MAG TPA: hypothetical protein VHY08_06675 [Bacillota bacterium]|nr:hypothetical protein [Bacillota bacterium]